MSEDVSSGAVTLYSGGARVIYQGDGGTTTFPVPFAVDGAADLQLFTAPLDDTSEAQVLDRSAWSYASSAVTVTSAPDSATKLVVMRTTPIERRGAYSPGGMLTANSLNGDLTRLTRIAQDLDERLKLIPGLGVGRVLTGDEVARILELYRMIGSGLVMLTSGGWLARAANNAASIQLANSGVFVSGGLAVDGGITVSNGGAVFQNSDGVATFTSRAVGEWTSGAARGGYIYAPGQVELHATVLSATGAYTSGGVVSLDTSGGKIVFRTLAGESRGIVAHGSGATVLGSLSADTFSVNGGLVVGAGAAVFGGMNVYGGMTVSGGLMVGSESAATQPWVIGQLGSSGFLKSEGGFTVKGRWTHSSTSGGQVTSVWGVRPEIDFTSGFKTTVYHDTEAPSSSGWRAVFDVNASVYPSATITIASGYVAAGILASLDGVRMWAPMADGSAYVEVGSAGGFSIGDVDGEGGADGTSGTGIDGNVHSLVLSQHHTSSGLDAALILSGGRVAVRTSSGGNVRAGNVLLDTDPLPAPSGAIVSGAEFHTVVGEYTLDYGSGGLLVSGGGVQFRVSSGAVTASGENYESVVLSGGTAKLLYDYDEVPQYVAVHGNGVDIHVSDPGRNVNIECSPGSVTVNSRPVLTALDTATDSETTSASFDVLSGGTSYVYTQPISAFDITSIASGCQAAMEFTAGANFTPSFPASAVKFGQSACDSGKHYVVVVNGSWVVVNEGRI